MRISHKIVKLLNQTPNLKAGEIIAKIKEPSTKVYQTLSYLHKTNKLKRNGQRYSVQFELPMTSMPIPAVKTQQETDKKYNKEMDALRVELDELKADHSELLTAYFDAKAVIKYLEEKLRTA